MGRDRFLARYGRQLEEEARRCLNHLGAIGDPALLVKRALELADNDVLAYTAVHQHLYTLAERIAHTQYDLIGALPAVDRREVRQSWIDDPAAAMRERPHMLSLADRYRHQEKPPLYRVIGAVVPTLIRACTPSVLMLEGRFPVDALDSDVSVSFDDRGSLANRQDAFAELFQHVAEYYEADDDRVDDMDEYEAWAGVAGTTGSNWSIARMLAFRLDPGDVVLVSRGSHISVPQALTDFAIDWRYIEGSEERRYDVEFEAVLPSDPEDVAAAIAQVTDGAQVGAVWINSPTYEGLFAATGRIREKMDQLAPDALLIVDEAWGSHLNAHPALKENAASLNGADIVASSTHKQAGGLQGTSVVVRPSGSRCDARQLNAAMQALTTTSPSYLLLSSMSWVYEELRRFGPYWIERLWNIADRLRLLLGYAVGRTGTQLVFADTLAQRYGDGEIDPLKVTVALSNFTNAVGLQVANELAHPDSPTRIIAEKAGINTLQFLVTFQMDRDPIPGDLGAHAKRVVPTIAALTAQAIAAVDKRREADGTPRPPLSDPFTQTASSRSGDRRSAAKAGFVRGELTPLPECARRVSGERVAAYPPGIPIILEGDEISQAQVDYLTAVCSAGGHLAWNGGHGGHLELDSGESVEAIWTLPNSTQPST